MIENNKIKINLKQESPECLLCIKDISKVYKKDNKESESIPFFKRAFNIVNDDMNNADEGRNENNENINENSDLLN